MQTFQKSLQLAQLCRKRELIEENMFLQIGCQFAQMICAPPSPAREENQHLPLSPSASCHERKVLHLFLHVRQTPNNILEN